MGILLGELGSAPAQLSRKDNRAINLPLFSKWETPIDDLTAALDITQEEIFFLEAKSTFVMILRSLPQTSSITRRPLRLDRVAEAAATMKNDSIMVRKGIRSMELLSQLQELQVIDKDDGFALLRDEVEQELVHLGSMKDKVLEETGRLEEVYSTIRDHNTYLVGQLETYKSYLHNVRSQSEGTRRRQQRQAILGPYKFTHQQLEREGVIQKSNVPENRRANIYFNFTSPLPGNFVISLHYKGEFLVCLCSRVPVKADQRRPESGALGARPETGRSVGDAERQPRGSRSGVCSVQCDKSAGIAEQALCAKEGMVVDRTLVSALGYDQSALHLAILSRRIYHFVPLCTPGGFPTIRAVIGTPWIPWIAPPSFSLILFFLCLVLAWEA